ncbi:hypothetical protein KBC79_03810 [Candidatus Woesebacteria bacterium]|nr:hypothetical protein [Candidatus Woesebacteria bacterium]
MGIDDLFDKQYFIDSGLRRTWKPAIPDGAAQSSETDSVPNLRQMFAEELARLKKEYRYDYSRPETTHASEVLGVLERLLDEGLADQRVWDLNMSSQDAEQASINPLTAEHVVLLNPATVMNLGMRAETFGTAKGINTMINEVTGDIGWFANEGAKFNRVVPIVESRGNKSEQVEMSQWTFDEYAEVVKQIAPFLLGDGHVAGGLAQIAAQPTVNGERWSQMKSVARAGELKATIDKMINFCGALPQQVRPDLTGRGVSASTVLSELKFPEKQVAQGYRVGLEITEQGQGDATETFKVFLYQKEDKSSSFQMPGEDWYVDVVCASGQSTTYKFGDTNYKTAPLVKKPVIYVYPTTPTEVTVDLAYSAGTVIAEYPKRTGSGWKVTAHPDGRLIESGTGKEYPYLFWEGSRTEPFSAEFAQGHCIAGADVVPFLEKELAARGLNSREITDFVTYWYPAMSRNPFNLVRFLDTEYTEGAGLAIAPQPESLIRVFMVFKRSETKVELAAPAPAVVTRNGYTVVEWGGSNLDE